MDERLRLAYGLRLLPPAEADLPSWAAAIVAASRGRAQVHRTLIVGRDAVHIWGDGVNVLIRGEDWDRIRPAFLDGQLDPTLASGSSGVVFFPKTDPADVPIFDRPAYEKTLALLRSTFTNP